MIPFLSIICLGNHASEIAYPQGEICNFIGAICAGEFQKSKLFASCNFYEPIVFHTSHK